MRALLLALCFTMTFPAAVYAAQSEWAHADHVRLKILSAVDSVADIGEFDAAIQLDLSGGWHTYWRVPGDSGLAPVFDWSGSQNISDVDLRWPAPVRKDENGFTTFAYVDDVLFPLSVTLKEPGKHAKLSLKADVMVCKDICIPQHLVTSLNLHPVEDKRSSQARVVEKARKSLPALEDTALLKIDTVVAGPDALALRVYSAKGFKDADMFVSVDGYGFTTGIEIEADKDDDRHAMIKIPKPADIESLNVFLEGKELSLVFVKGKNALEKMLQF